MLSEITQEELSAALDGVADEILAQGHVDRPPVDAAALAGRLGLEILMDDAQEGRARFVRLGGYRGSQPRGAILLRSDPRPERRQWAVAHEIGESTAYRVFAALGIDPREISPVWREAVANYLAGRLLLPAAWLTADAAACRWDLLALKQIYATASHELIARRMLDFAPPIIITVIDQEQISLRRSNVRGRVPPMSAAEKECWKSVHQHNRPEETRETLSTIRGWPIHEEGWEREILRREVSAGEENAEC